MISSKTIKHLKEIYSGKNRFYHNWHHVEECLGHLNDAVKVAGNFEALEAAILFHDAVYNTRAEDNGGESAELAREMLRGQLSEELIDEIERLILITKHGTRPSTPDEKLMVDIDLGIFGASRKRYKEYENQIKKEYGWVTGDLFRKKRAEIIENFMKPPIYQTNFFRDRYENAARGNLNWSIGELRAS